MNWHNVSVRRTHRGREFEFSARVNGDIELDLEFHDDVRPRSWFRRLFRLEAKVVTTARTIIKSAGAGEIMRPELRELDR